MHETGGGEQQSAAASDSGEFRLYDLKVETVVGGRPVVCRHVDGAAFRVEGEELVFEPGARVSMYALAALLPLLPAKQRDTDPADWIGIDAEIACPDPHCGGRFRVTRLGKRRFTTAGTSGAPGYRGQPYWQQPDSDSQDSTVTVETSLLRPDHPISRVIKGGWQLAGDHGSVDRRQAIADMTAFLDAGITTFDCADIYAGVEDMIGAFIEDVRQSRGVTESRRVCVHTKLVPDMSRLLDLRDDEIEAIVDRSLKRLGIEQLHLVQFYWWDLTLGDPWNRLAHLMRLKDKGRIRHVAMTNFNEAEGERFIEAGIELISTQLQYSLLDRRPAKSFAAWAAKRDVAILAYGTLAGGFLSETWLGRPDPGFAFQNRSLVKYRLIIDEFGSWDLFQDLLAALKSIGVRHGVSLSAVASRWVLDQPQVAAAIVGARYASHLSETLSVLDIKLDAADLALIDAVLERAKGPGGPVYGLERDRKGRHGRIMKYNLNANPTDAVLGDGW